ncbi:MAG: hypothetical protein HY613_08620 [Candidatus Rokubacteria bacterium]|nr:hypothetical protein [Candidatus Rokubacteria bacterium]
MSAFRPALWACCIAALAAGEALGAPCAVVYTPHKDQDRPDLVADIGDAMSAGPGAQRVLFAHSDAAWSKAEALASEPPKASTDSFEAKVEECARGQDAEAEPRLVVYINSHGGEGLFTRSGPPVRHRDLVEMLLAQLDEAWARAGRPLPLTIFYDACHAHSLAAFLDKGGAAAKDAEGKPRYLIDLYSSADSKRLSYRFIMPASVKAIAEANKKGCRPGSCFDSRDDGIFIEACYPNSPQVWSSYRTAAAPVEIPLDKLAALLDETDRGFAIHALGQYGPKAEKYSDAVAGKLKGATAVDWDTSEAAGFFFSQVKTDAAVAAVLKAGWNPSASYPLRRKAVEILGRIGTRKAVEELARLAGGPYPVLADDALRALCMVDADLLDAVPTASLLRRLKLHLPNAYQPGKVPEFVLLARKREVAVLVAFLGDNDERYRIEAALALGKVGPIAIPALAEALWRAKNEYCAHYAAVALGLLPSPAACLALEEGTRGRRLFVIEHSIYRVADACKGRDVRGIYERALAALEAEPERFSEPARLKRVVEAIRRKLAKLDGGTS